MTEFWDKPAEKSGKVLAAFLEGLPLHKTMIMQARTVDTVLVKTREMTGRIQIRPRWLEKRG
jgi:hypothetical protein